MDDSSEQDPAKVLRIRKYPNRRYYDTTRSRHLTLEELYAAVRDGYEIGVTDSKTGQDITAKVLAQIIIDLDPPKLGVFPVRLLHRLLRANEELVQDFTQKYFNRALEAFLDRQRKLEQSMRQALGLRAPVPTVADWTRMMWGPFNPGEGGAANPANSASSADHQTVEDLRKQIADLQRQLGRKSRGKSKRAKRPRKS